MVSCSAARTTSHFDGCSGSDRVGSCSQLAESVMGGKLQRMLALRSIRNSRFAGRNVASMVPVDTHVPSLGVSCGGGGACAPASAGCMTGGSAISGAALALALPLGATDALPAAATGSCCADGPLAHASHVTAIAQW